MVDTQFFPPEFKSRLLSFIPDFDAQCDGLLIHSENFQALNLLQERYREQVKCIYIDPPYNTGNDGFIYRDNFQHSSWLSMMEDRLSISRNLMNNAASFFSSIDDNELVNLKKIFDEVFGFDNLVGQITVVGNPRGRDYGGIARMHDYIIAYRNSYETIINLISDENSNFKMFDSIGGFELRELRNRNIKFNRDNRPNLYYPFYINTNDIDEHGLCTISIQSVNGWLELWPLESQGISTVWRWGKEKAIANLNINIKAKPMRNGSYMIVEKYRESRIMARSVWWDKDTNTEKGTLLLKDLFEDKIFDYPKPMEMLRRICEMGTMSDSEDFILDFFAGSGTTGHAVINLNREDQGSRKYILVEMGAHFDTVLKPRIEKVVYSPDWKDGKPTSLDKGVSHCFKYIRLESYEDTLNNLELPKSDPIAQSMPSELREEYMLRYLLETESRDSLCNLDMFANPFGGYCLNIKRPGSEASESTPIDLIETFNYLIGLRVTQYYMPRRYSARFKRAVDPELPGEEGSRRLVLDGKPKRDDNGKWRFECIEGVVPAHPLNPNNGQTKRVLIIWRNLTGNLERDNAVLDWLADDIGFNDKVPEYDVVYVNGCNNLGADRKETDSYQVRLIEEEFFKKMWG